MLHLDYDTTNKRCTTKPVIDDMYPDFKQLTNGMQYAVAGALTDKLEQWLTTGAITVY